eukprot:scaffold16504_cov105-Isochrysis_galbana.AAC.2
MRLATSYGASPRMTTDLYVVTGHCHVAALRGDVVAVGRVAGGAETATAYRPMPTSRALALSLFGLGVLTRFAYLTYPREVVFDEYHFGKFINGYITGARRPLALTVAQANGRRRVCERHPSRPAHLHLLTRPAASLCAGQYFFDIHPPLGKLLLAAAARAGGYDASQVRSLQCRQWDATAQLMPLEDTMSGDGSPGRSAE